MMRTALADLIEQSEGVTNGVVHYRITDFVMPDLGSFRVEFPRLPYTARMAALSMDQILQ